MKIIVTGGAGFIGSNFIRKLNQEGITNILIVDNLGKSEKWNNLVDLRYDDYIHKNKFIDLITRNKIPEGFRTIIHMGACSDTTEEDADYLMRNNFQFTQLLAHWAMSEYAYFIYASSASTYGNGEHGFSDIMDITKLQPKNRYAYSKHFFDLYAKNRGIDKHIVGLKFFNVFGPNEYHKNNMASMIYKAFHQIQQTGQINLFKSHDSDYDDGNQMRDFIYIKDCIDVIWWFMNHIEVKGLYNLGTGNARTWNDLTNIIFQSMDRSPIINYIDMPNNLREGYQYFTQADMQKLKNTGCSVTFQPLEETIPDYISNYLQPRQHKLF